jgi:hypothetical protein
MAASVALKMPCYANVLVKPQFEGRMLDVRQISISCLVAVLLSGCMSASSLENSQQTAIPAQTASSEQYYDACVIAKTGTVPNGQRLPKEAVRAIRSELERRQVDCNTYLNPAIASGRTQSQTPMQSQTPSLSFQE